MTYEETLQQFHSFRSFGKQPGLLRMTELMRILGNPQDSLRIIHVAGTNGKGSVCRYLYSALSQAGYCCGLYTSPYIEHFTERIQLCGAEIPQAELVRTAQDVFEAAEQMRQTGQEEPTEFDIITAVAFLYFARQKAEFVVLETGLGGRFDSTNVISSPELAIITSISRDHTAILGNTLEEIAWEKAGICKSGVPLIFAVKDRAAARVICCEAQKKGAEVFDVLGTVKPACAGQPSALKKKIAGYSYTSDVLGYTYDTIELGMAGMHQVENSLCALTALELLRRGHACSGRPVEISRKQIRDGMRSARQPGRLELVRKNPPVILDGAHNPDGMQALCAALCEHFRKKRILLILGVLKDKPVSDMLQELRVLAAESNLTIAATEPENPRKLPATELACAVQAALCTDCLQLPSWREALMLAKEASGRGEIVVVAGSLYLIGAIREGWRREHEESAVDL